LLADGRLSAGHARTLVNAADPAALARQILDRGLSVRQAEALAQSPSPAAVAARRAPRPEKDPNTAAVEKQLSDATGMTVSIHHRGYGGDVVITYRMLDQLEELCRRLQR
jgi:ParB family chromosome partitioning protein